MTTQKPQQQKHRHENPKKRESMAVFFDGGAPLLNMNDDDDELDPNTIDMTMVGEVENGQSGSGSGSGTRVSKRNSLAVPSGGNMNTTQTGTASEGSKSPMTNKYTSREHKFIVAIAMILAFNSGFSNGVCLSGILTPQNVRWQAQSTSGFTGGYTKSALALADQEGNFIQGFTQIEFFGYQLLMILSFMGGSCISALMNPRPAPWRLAPMYAPTFFIGGVFMCIAAVLSVEDISGTAHFYYFVAAANGIQNGISSMYSANLIRTTHLTGASTDIGLFIGQAIRGNNKNSWKLRILIGLALSFWTGGLLSFWAVQVWLQYTLLVNAAIFLFVFCVCVWFLAHHLHIPAHRALQGTWHWQKALHDIGYRSGQDGSAQSKEALKEIFAKMDVDGNGDVNREEFIRGLKAAGLNEISQKQFNAMFDVCDTSGDGTISFQEFQQLVEGDNALVG
mmetsp:Transcript_46015/g.111428  ORF Transcript_46015/g.111428 Transcript_46015/m.111428 type:complete len:450 (+) Transcript_46015:86-1435(+)